MPLADDHERVLGHQRILAPGLTFSYRPTMMKKLLPLLLLPVLAAPAFGQGSPSANGTPTFASKGAGQAPKKEDAPPAVPGARAEPTAVAPAERNAADLPPTEALFDAINRGDLPTARDAINRGADLNGINVLGLTPLELAVDLGRNEISFVLLTLRGGNGYTTAHAPAPLPQPTRAERQAAARTARNGARGGRTDDFTGSNGGEAVAARPPANTVPQAARLFAGQGGTPIPQAGFLGFDAGH
jgi:hypothetical protein